MTTKTIGIWGFGKVGKSAAQHLHAQEYQLNILDKRQPTPEEQLFLQEKNITWYDQNNEKESELFFNFSDFIIPSPGINISQPCYATHKDKWLPELDFFYENFHKPIIAITGSIGKTSTTHILAQLFQELAMGVAVGGNIGTVTFDLIEKQNKVDFALLEVSSFQLMHCKKFAPTIAVWTNFYPNHLDYHATEDEYFYAKYNIMKNQAEHTFSFVPLTLKDKIPISLHNHTRAYFLADKPLSTIYNTLENNEIIYYTYNNMIWRYAQDNHTTLLSITPEIMNLSFIENIILITGICDMLKCNPQALQTIAAKTQLPAHRLEKIGSANNIIFYNDSKGTTTISTLAAVEKLKHYPLHLFLGGLSKGVNRAPFVAQLKNDVKYIYCFGKEAHELYIMCQNNNIPAMHFATLHDAVDACMKNVQPNDCVLLSPAGSSYDLYENYEHRGNHFKELIKRYLELT
jgi:UDP-N-acetylmuramoylalanine--D-glutamate ligase